MENQKGISALAVIIIIVVITLIVVVAFFSFAGLNKGGSQDESGVVPISKNENNISKWNVYRTNQYGFEFKFPGHGKVNDLYFGNTYAFAVGVTSKNWGDGAVVVIDHGNVGTMTLSEFVAKDLGGQGESGAIVKEAELNGYKGVSVKGKNKTGYYLLHNLDVYELYKTSGVAAGDADKIFSSFKFIEQ